MKKLLDIFIIILLPFIAATQDYFSYQFDVNNDAESGLWISQVGDKTAILVGAKCNNNTTNCIEVLRLDENSELIWSLLIDTVDVVQPDNFVTTEESFYIAGVLSGQSRIGIKVMQFSWDGELINHIDLSDQFPVSTVNSMAMVDSSLLLTFNKRGDGEHLGITPDTTYYYFMDQDLNYQRHFTNTSGEYRFEVGTSLKAAADESGYYGIRWASNSGWPRPFYLDLIKFDSLGNEIWTYAMDYSPIGRTADYATTPDGGVIIAWNEEDWETVEPIFPEPSKLIKVNTQGEMEWEYLFNSVHPKELISIFPAQNGDIIGVGLESFYDLEVVEYGAYSTGWIFRITQEGELLWERNILDTRFLEAIPDMRLYHGMELDNGDLMFTGVIQDTFPNGVPFINNPNTWLVRTDSMGCLHPDCDRLEVITATDDIIMVSPESPFTLYPSPARDQINILYQGEDNIYPLAVNIYSAQGKLIQTDILTSPLQGMNIDTFSGGIYWLVLSDKNGRIYHQSFIKQ